MCFSRSLAWFCSARELAGAWLAPRNSPGNTVKNDPGKPPGPRVHRGPTPLGTVLDGLAGAYLPRGAHDSLGAPDPETVAAVLPPGGPLEPPGVRLRLDVHRAVERAVERALWRAERRSRLVSRKTRQTVSWVMGQRRRMAYELMRTFASMHLGDALSRQLAANASERFPRDGVVVADPPRRGSRSSGTSPRQLGTNRRTTGQSSRELPG